MENRNRFFHNFCFLHSWFVPIWHFLFKYTICSFSNGLGRTPLNLLFVLFTFVPIWIGVWVAMKFIHHIPMKVLFSPSGKLDLPRLFKAFSIMLFWVLVLKVDSNLFR